MASCNNTPASFDRTVAAIATTGREPDEGEPKISHLPRNKSEIVVTTSAENSISIDTNSADKIPLNVITDAGELIELIDRYTSCRLRK